MPALIVAMAIALLVGCTDEAPSTDVSEQADAAPPEPADMSLPSVPFEAPAFDLLVDDFDGDGSQDLAFTSHHDSYTQLFLQRSPRTFTPGPRVEAVGFHPGDLVRLPEADRRLYLMNAEGASALRVFEPARDGGLSLVSELGISAPRVATPFTWPDWGRGLAVGPFATSTIFLLNDFDPVTGRHAGGAQVPFTPGVAYANGIVAADLDGDGADELLFTNTISNEVSVIRAPGSNGLPRLETLWTFKPGGRAEQVTPADIDQDGDLDLLVPDATDKRPLDRTAINVLINDGQGGLSLSEIAFPSRTRSEGGMPGIQALDYARERDGTGYLLSAGYESLILMRIPTGWLGETPEQLTLPFQRRFSVSELALRDLDGDGWLDAIIARPNGQASNRIIYGPLWERFTDFQSEESVFD